MLRNWSSHRLSHDTSSELRLSEHIRSHMPERAAEVTAQLGAIRNTNAATIVSPEPRPRFMLIWHMRSRMNKQARFKLKLTSPNMKVERASIADESVLLQYEAIDYEKTWSPDAAELIDQQHTWIR